MNIFISLIIIAFLAGAVFLGIYKSIGRETNQLRQLEQSRREQERATCESIEEDLREWLRMLELPQFEEQTKRAAVARQLRIVLVEPLVRGPNAD